MRTHRVARGLLIVLRTVLLSFLAAELFLRWVRPVEFRAPDPEPPDQGAMLFQRSTVTGLLYETVPHVEKIVDGASVKTNSYGMREHEPLPNDTPSLVRLVTIGDSFTFGLGVPVEETFPKELERLLIQSAAGDRPRYEVLNLAVPGYSAQDEVVLLRAKGLVWDPKVVVLGYCLNDPDTRPLQPLDVYFHGVEWWQYSHLLRLVNLLWMTFEVRRYGGGDYYLYLHSPQADQWQSVPDAFDAMRELTQPRNVEVVVVIFPLIEVGSWAEYRYQPIHEQVAATARSHRFHVVDLLPIFSPHPPAQLKVSPLDHHPSRLAHRLAAEAIFATLRDEGLLASTPGN